MRSTRLMDIVVALEARGRATAGELAERFGVSVRTIYRDMDALGAAGIPVYADRGAAGGFRLVEGYRMRPPALTPQEAAALWLAGLPEAARGLGLEPELDRAQAKLLASMGPKPREEAVRVRERLYIEEAAWFGTADEPPFLALVTEAVWSSRLMRVRYRSWTTEAWRTLLGLGLVLKGGVWYLVARDIDRDVIRTYRVAAMLECEMRAETGTRPPGFDLGAHWRRSSAEFLERLYPLAATLRLSPEGMRQLEHLGTAVYVSGMTIMGPPDASGHRCIRLPFETIGEAARDLLRLGAEAEVLDPAELRAEIYRLARLIADGYEAADGFGDGS